MGLTFSKEKTATLWLWTICWNIGILFLASYWWICEWICTIQARWCYKQHCEHIDELADICISWPLNYQEWQYSLARYSSDLATPDFSISSYLKCKVIETNPPRTKWPNLRSNSNSKWIIFNLIWWHAVMDTFTRRLQDCVRNKGHKLLHTIIAHCGTCWSFWKQDSFQNDHFHISLFQFPLITLPVHYVNKLSK